MLVKIYDIFLSYYFEDWKKYNYKNSLERSLNATTSFKNIILPTFWHKQDANLPSGGHGSLKYSPQDGALHGHHRSQVSQTTE